MKTLKIFAVIIAVIIVVLVLISWWLGAFTRINIIEKEEGGYVFVGKDFIGDYSKVSKPMMEVDGKLRAIGFKCGRGFGIYYDNPENTPREKCHSFVGNIIEEKDYARIEDIKNTGLKIDTLQPKQAMVIEFPFKNRISFFIGVMKAYPAFTKYMSEKHYKPSLSIEIYDMPNKKIYYIMQYDR